MALLGSSIDPRLQLQDYSGIVNAAQMQAQGLANIGSQIEQAAEQYKQYKKEQADTQKRVKAAANLADSISALVPELRGPLGATVAQLKDPNLTLADKDALAQSISSTLQLGIGVVTGNKELALQERQVGLAERTAKQAITDKELADQIAKNQKALDEQIKQETDAYKAAALIAGYKGQLQKVGKNVPDDIANSISKLVNEGKGTAALQVAEGYGQSVPDIAKLDTIESKFRDPVTGQPTEATIQVRDGKFIIPNIDIEVPQGDQGLLPSRQPGEFQTGPGVLPERQISSAASMMLPQEMQGQAAAAPPAGPRIVSVPLSAPARQTPLVSVSNAPTPPPGYQNIFDQQGNLVRQEIIPGSPADTAAKAEEEAKKVRAENYLATLGDYYTKLNKDIYQGTGVIGANARAISQRILGTEMNKLQGLKSTLDANAFVNTIARLRENSPTGATGLGSVTEREGQRLVDLSGNIDPINIETAKANTERLLMEVADQAYGTKEFRDKQLKNKEITRKQYEEIMDLRGVALRGEFGKMLNLKIQAEREAGNVPRSSIVPSFDPNVEELLKSRGF